MTSPRVVLLLAALAAPLLAVPVSGQRPGIPQDRASWTRGVIHYGKWLSAGAAVGFTIMGAHEHSHSNRSWDLLLGVCQADNAACAIGVDGRYVDATAEYHYQRALFFDRRANRRILGGQLALLATATMFILDLRDRTEEPENVPFAPLRVSVSPATERVQVGVRLTF
jgi:hypothetical protein